MYFRIILLGGNLRIVSPIGPVGAEQSKTEAGLFERLHLMFKSELKAVPISEIRENPVALRSVNRDSEGFKGMVDSVRTNGILNPINVRRKTEGKGGKPDGKQYEVIDGLHRYTAATEAGLTEIPAQVFEMADADALVAQIVGNFHKVQTKPVEYTRGLLRILSQNPFMTISELAAMLSVTPGFIDQRLNLTKLDPKIAELVDSGQINLSNAFPLAKLPIEEQNEWVERAMTQGAGEFGPAALARHKAIQAAKRAGREAAPAVFEPIAHLRQLKDIKDEYMVPSRALALITRNNVDPTDAKAVFALAIAWTLCMDKDSKEAAIVADKERCDREEKAKLQRDEERKRQRAVEAQQKQAELLKQAEDARKKREAAGLPPLPPPTEGAAKAGDVKAASTPAPASAEEKKAPAAAAEEKKAHNPKGHKHEPTTAATKS